MKTYGLLNFLFRNSLLLIFFIGYLPSIKSQIVKVNCIQPKEIYIPFENTDTEKVYYQNHDGVTFWYKIKPTQSGLLSYYVETANSGGSFEAKLFSFDGAEFCKQMVKGNVEPTSTSLSKEIKVKKGHQYYLGVDVLGESNCAHAIKLSFNDDNKKIYTLKYGSSCAEKQIYENSIVEKPIAQKDKVIIGGISLSGKVRSAKTNNLLTADMQFSSTHEDYSIGVISNRNKGYEVQLEKGKSYKLYIKAMGYVSIDTLVNVKNEKQQSFKMNPVETGQKFIINNIYFYPNTYAYKPGSEEALEELKDYMLENKKIKIEIQGHSNGNKEIKKNKTQSNEDAEWNFVGSARELSKNRADKLKTYLVQSGISKKRITTVGKGGDEMIVPNPKTMKEAMKNIRVEIKVLSN